MTFFPPSDVADVRNAAEATGSCVSLCCACAADESSAGQQRLAVSAGVIMVEIGCVSFCESC